MVLLEKYCCTISFSTGRPTSCRKITTFACTKVTLNHYKIMAPFDHNLASLGSLTTCPVAKQCLALCIA
jgi:hypothetical protein